ncbi:hypothetical protein V1L54_11340 [Streptomyces sp. TRM 70361]|uniref:hypothetical protein n=1 Tax=Streptomyces sp. TRM 70361 TaxID=3116553 RepID=UPI002E7B539C|nr:hypothetical protein [Streptomyces sp. TRM 70361]MEE1939986.1 hypothetical protein [Streptomyces sp. TRM 70361]
MAVGVLLAALLAAGCGSGPAGEGADGGETPAGGATTRAGTSRPAPTGTPSATSSPPAPKPTASDGTRYSACADGTCEVAVARPVDITVGGGTFSVKGVKPGHELTFEIVTADGATGSGTLKGCGTVLSFSPGGGGVTSTACDAGGVPEPPDPEPGALLIQMAGWSADRAAVLRLVSG